MMRLRLDTAEATEALARALAATQAMPAVVHLQGDLGAGKSTLARAWLRTLGVAGTIRSPTYTLVERYPLPAGGEAVHLDLYRIADAAELEFLALDDAAGALWLVEWPERGGAALPVPDLQIELAVAGSGRTARMSGSTASGGDWLVRLTDSGQLPPVTEP